MKLSTMPHAQATVVPHTDGAVTLLSYNTDVAFINAEGWLYIFGLYSATTRKHIGAFVKEYAGIDYKTARTICEHKQWYNIHTGEVKGGI
jgi:hypothetical protein